MPGLEPLEEWLAGQEQRLQGSLSKAWQSLLTITVPILLSLTPVSLPLKVAGAALWVSLLLNLRLWSRVCALRVEARKKQADDTRPPKEADSLSDLEFSLLSMMYDYYPERYTHAELEKLSGAPRVEVDHALMTLLGRTPKLIIRPRGGLHYAGQPRPDGWGLSTEGIGRVKTKRSEQDVAQQPARA